MSTERQVSFPADPADAFAVVYDQLDALWKPTNPLATQRLLSQADQLADIVEASALDGALGSVAAPELWDPLILLAWGLGLDRALRHVSPRLARPIHRAGHLGKLLSRYLTTGRLSTDAVSGAVVPRWVTPGRQPDPPNSLRGLFKSALRISGQAYAQAEHLRVPQVSAVPDESEAPLLVAAMPVIDVFADVDCRRISGAGDSAFYSVRPRASIDSAKRRALLSALDRSGAAIAVLPEATLSQDDKRAWCALMADTPRAMSNPLRFVLLGSGPMDSGTVEPPHNRAILVTRDGGRVVAEQDKMHPFTLESAQIGRWGLGDCLKNGPLGEYVTAGLEMNILETQLGRLVVLVCEDIAQLIDVGPTVRDFGVSLILSPVFTDEVKEHRWEQEAATSWRDQVGTTSIVSNSLIVASAKGLTANVGTSGAMTPSGYVVASSSKASDVAVFEVSRRSVALRTAGV